MQIKPDLETISGSFQDVKLDKNNAEIKETERKSKFGLFGLAFVVFCIVMAALLEYKTIATFMGLQRAQHFEESTRNDEIQYNDLRMQMVSGNSKIEEAISNLQLQVSQLSKEIEEMKASNSNQRIAPGDSKESQNSTLISFEINVANKLIGASVDRQLSSSSNLTSFFLGDQTEYVILDRPYLPIGTAWCFTDEQPVLTINLAKYIKPVALSYQHADWDGSVPDEVPKKYDVLACLDSDCKYKTLMANCEYLPSKDQPATEQKCAVKINEDIPLVNKVQFIFRSNHGKSKQTCVNLVRVYAEKHRPVKKTTEKQLKHLQRVELENERTCANLANLYYTKKLSYYQGTRDCVTLYSKNCCSACPECCEECVMEVTHFNTDSDTFAHNISKLLAPAVMILFWAAVFLLAILIKFYFK